MANTCNITTSAFIHTLDSFIIISLQEECTEESKTYVNKLIELLYGDFLLTCEHYITDMRRVLL